VGLDQIDLVEINEAFACQVLAVLKGLRWNDAERLNVNGSGISLGHPIAATGVRIMHAAARVASKGAAGSASRPCIGGGQGLAALFERV
jgi:acetyl-CoA C-acetyltransferase